MSNNVDLVNYLYSIVIDNKKNNNQKASELYDMCNYKEFIAIYKAGINNGIDNNKLKIILNMYHLIERYDVLKVGNQIIDDFTTKTTVLNQLFNIINSEYSDLYKAYELFSCFSSSNMFIKNYYLNNNIINYNKNKIEKIMSYYEKYEKLGLNKQMDYYIKLNKQYDVSNYSLFIVKEFINFDINNIDNFYSVYGINKQIFDYCVNVVNEINVDLYNEYCNKEKNIKDNNIKKIDEIYNAISTGKKTDGTPFELLDFVINVPMKKEINFKKAMDNFLIENKPEARIKINNYIIQNRIFSGAFDLVSLNELNQNRIFVHGKEVTEADNIKILNYIENKGLEANNIVFRIIREKYLNNELDEEYFKTNNKTATIIPKIK